MYPTLSLAFAGVLLTPSVLAAPLDRWSLSADPYSVDGYPPSAVVLVAECQVNGGPWVSVGDPIPGGAPVNWRLDEVQASPGDAITCRAAGRILPEACDFSDPAACTGAYASAAVTLGNAPGSVDGLKIHR